MNATIWIDREGARVAAEQADAVIAAGSPLGKLHGIPMAHKDMYYQAGKVSTCGSMIRQDWVADRTATVLERLHAAGSITFAGLNMAEFAQNPTGHNRHFGDCHNPVEPAVHHRRVLERVGRCGGGPLRLRGTWVGHGRVGPAACRRVRGDRVEADADAGQPGRGHAAQLLGGQCGPADPHGAGLRPGHARDRRPRSRGPDLRGRAGAGLRGGADGRPARRAGRAVDQPRVDGQRMRRSWPRSPRRPVCWRQRGATIVPVELPLIWMR